MSENIVYEMTQMIRNKNAIQSDMSDALGLVQKMFQDKYISKIHDVVQTHQVKAKSNPPKEVALLHALKPYMTEDKHTDVDKLIDSFIMLNTFQNIRSELTNGADNTVISERKVEAASIPEMKEIADPSVHDDGVYDVDSTCLVNKQRNDSPKGGQLAALLMLSMFSKIN